jgi:hypothetical protein
MRALPATPDCVTRGLHRSSQQRRGLHVEWAPTDKERDIRIPGMTFCAFWKHRRSVCGCNSRPCGCLMAHPFSSLAYLLTLVDRRTGLWDWSCPDLGYSAVNSCRLRVEVVAVKRGRSRFGTRHPNRWKKCQGALWAPAAVRPFKRPLGNTQHCLGCQTHTTPQSAGSVRLYGTFARSLRTVVRSLHYIT